MKSGTAQRKYPTLRVIEGTLRLRVRDSKNQSESMKRGTEMKRSAAQRSLL